MDVLRFAGNVLWFVVGGVIAGLMWYLAGLIAAATIVGLPWAFACFRLGNYTFFPFGRELVPVTHLTGRDQGAMGPLRLIGNIIWFVPLGFALMVVHLIAAVLWFATIVGIPFGFAHLKLAQASVFPLGKRIVSTDVAALARQHNATNTFASARSR